MGSARTWIQRVLAAVLVLVVLAGVASLVVWNTEAGARWALRQIEARVPGGVEVSGMSGTLRRGLDLEHVVFEQAATRIEARALRLAIDWAALWDGQLVFNELRAESVRIDQPEPPAEPEPFKVSMEPVPLPVFSAAGWIGQLILREEGPLADVRDVRWTQLKIDGQGISARQLSASAAGYSAVAANPQIRIQDTVPLSMDLEWRASDAGWTGSGPVRGDLQELRLEQQVGGPYPAEVQGSIRLLGRVEPIFEATVDWSEWTVADYPVRSGRVQLEGVPGDYGAAYQFELDHPEVGIARVSGTGRGDLDGLRSLDAQIDTDSGSASATGQLSWAAPWSASAQLTLSGLDPALFHPSLSGSLHGDAALAIGEARDLHLSGLDLEGQLNGSPFRGSGSLEFGEQVLRCQSCDIRLGSNQLKLDGTLGRESLSLQVEADAPDLGAVWPGLAGRLDARGVVDGSLALPRFRGKVNGASLRWQSWSAARLEVDSQGAGSDAVNLEFVLGGIASGDQSLGEAVGTVSGPLDDLALTLGWKHDDTEAEARLSLQQENGMARGALLAATVDDPRTGTWRLQEPAAFSVGPDAWRIEALEWRAADGNLQIARLAMADGEFTAVAELEALPLAIFEFAVPGGMALTGTASASVDVRNAGGAWTGTIQWRQHATVLGVRQFDGEVTEIGIPTVEMEAQLANGGATATVAVTVNPGVTGELDLALDALSASAQMEAELRLQGHEWEWVPVVIPQVDRIEGAVAAEFRAHGPLRSPGLSGQLRWTDGSLVVPALNVLLTGIDLRIEGAPEATATVSGRATAGSGSLEINGEISKLLQADREIVLRLTGDSAELLNWPEYRVWGSPQLVLKADRGGWNITGDLHVDRTEIAVAEPPEEAVTPSPDVIVVGAETAEEETADYAGEVRLHLGDYVRVQAFGLDTRLEGGLLLRQAAGRPLRAEGRVSLAEGVFEAYGQKLTIEEGTLTFTGPLDNPLVDVRAVREAESFSGKVTAGIHLTGRAKSINSTVYSEPAMPEAEALSYLVLGQPLDQASSSEGSQLSAAALSLGLRQANRITGQIGRSVGLDQLTLTADGGEGTALVAGKQINSRLYARYAYGVFSRLGTLLLRYRLSQRLTLEAGTGENQSVDVLYTVEKY